MSVKNFLFTTAVMTTNAIDNIAKVSIHNTKVHVSQILWRLNITKKPIRFSDILRGIVDTNQSATFTVMLKCW